MKNSREKKTESKPIINKSKKHQETNTKNNEDYGAIEKPRILLRGGKKPKMIEKEVEVKEIHQKVLNQPKLKKVEKINETKEIPLKKKKKKETDEEQPDVEDENEITIDDAVERIGVGRFQHIALFATGLCFCADSMEIALLSFLSLVVSAEWGLDNTQTASITGVVFAGEIMGAFLLGYLGDILGRRPTFLIAALLITISGAGSALAYDFTSLLLFRFFVGVGVGGLTVPFDIFAEFLPLKQRGLYLMLVNYFWTFGSLLVPVFAYLTFGLGRSWRLFVLLCSIPCFISAVVCYFCIPESPRWLASQNRGEEALSILRDAANWNGIPPMKVFPSHIRIAREEPDESSYLELLTPKWRKISLFMWGVWFGFGFGYNGVVLVITQVFETDQGSTIASSQENVLPTFDYEAIAWSSFAETLGVFIAILTVNRWGRIKSQMVYFAGAGISCVAMLMPQLSTYTRTLVCLAFSARAFEISANCITWITAAEVMKTELRTIGHSAANVFCRIGAVLTSYVVQGGTSFLHIGIVMGVIHAFTVVCVSQLPETKDVKLN